MGSRRSSTQNVNHLAPFASCKFYTIAVSVSVRQKNPRVVSLLCIIAFGFVFLFRPSFGSSGFCGSPLDTITGQLGLVLRYEPCHLRRSRNPNSLIFNCSDASRAC